jgi:hypothetical protein
VNKLKYIKEKCDFAKAVYNKYLEESYGISICCDLDFEKSFVKVRLQELASIYDEKACVVQQPIIECCYPPCEVNAELFVVIPEPCEECEIISVEFSIG